MRLLPLLMLTFLPLLFSCQQSENEMFAPSIEFTDPRDATTGKQHGLQEIINYKKGTKTYKQWEQGTVIYEMEIDSAGSKYLYLNPIEEIVYSRQYDAKGKFVRQQGSPFLYTRMAHVKNLQISDSLRLDVYVANPPGTSHTVYWKTDDTHWVALPADERAPYKTRFRQKFDKTGWKLWRYAIEYCDSVSGETNLYHHEFAVEVVDSAKTAN